MRYIPEHPPKGSAEAYAWAEKMRAARQKKARIRHAVRQAGLEAEAKFFGPGGPLAPAALKKRKLNPGAKWHEGEENVAYRYKKTAKDPLEKTFFAGVEAAHKTSASAARKMGMNPVSETGYMNYHGWDLTVGTRKQPKVFSRLLNGFEHHLQKEPQGWRLLEANKGMGMRDMVSVGVYPLLTDAVIVADKRAYKRNSPKKVKKNPIAIYNPAEVAGTIYNNAIEIRAQKTGGPLKGHYKHIFDSNKVKILGLKDGTVLLQHKEGKPLWITRKDYERSGRKH